MSGAETSETLSPLEAARQSYDSAVLQAAEAATRARKMEMEYWQKLREELEGKQLHVAAGVLRNGSRPSAAVTRPIENEDFTVLGVVLDEPSGAGFHSQPKIPYVTVADQGLGFWLDDEIEYYISDNPDESAPSV